MADITDLDIKIITAQDHVELFEIFEGFRKQNSAFRYFTRRTNQGGAFKMGRLFYGSDYASVCLVDEMDGITGVAKAAFVKGIRKDNFIYYLEISSHNGDIPGYQFATAFHPIAEQIVKSHPEKFEMERFWNKPENTDCHYCILIKAENAKEATELMMEYFYTPLIEKIEDLNLDHWLRDKTSCIERINNSLKGIQQGTKKNMFPASVK